jgi:hypothetical protein
MALFRLATTLVTAVITSFATALVITTIAKTAVIVTWASVIAWSAVA